MQIFELENRIRQRAYTIWEQSGRPEGCEGQHWEAAAREVMMSGRAGDATEGKAAAKRPRSAKSAGAKGRSRKLAA